MYGKVMNVTINDLHGNVEKKVVRIYACFEHLKYMNNYVVFSVLGENKLCFGSIHFKGNTLVIFSVKNSINKYILDFLDEYINNKSDNYKLIDISNINKVELVSYSNIEYDKIDMLDRISIPNEVEKKNEIVEKKKFEIGYVLIFILVLFGVGLTILYVKPEWFIVKNKKLECSNNIFDENIGLYYDIDKDIIFDGKDKLKSISVVRTYIFLDSDKYYEFRDNGEENNYFNNGEGYKYIDDELKLKVFYNENSIIDDYDEMLTYLKKEGFICIESEYEE